MKKILVFLFLLTVTIAKAQYFQTGQDPSSIKWRQINTDNFQLIYPDYYENQAQLLAQKLEKVYTYASYTLKYKPQKISVILHTQTVNSNGLVAYAPKRSEFYTTPHQAIYPLDWLEQLAVHEFRHVVQIDKINSELPKIFKLLLGEQGTALVFGAYLPWWFIEGDAVVTETALSNYGRGRLPSFLMEHRALVVEMGADSYDKAYLGSYKDYVPNHYMLGYYLVGNARERYGADLWEKVMKRVGRKPFSFTPFNSALKTETGLNKVELYQEVFDSLARVWKTEDASFVSRAGTVTISKPSETYTNYRYNHWLNNHEIIAYKTGFDDIPAFVKIDQNGREEILLRPGTIFDESVGYSGEWIVWSEQVPDLRWSHSGRSVIQLFNVNTKHKIHFNTEYKAFAPALSSSHEKILVVEADFSNNYYLTVYDVVSGKMVSRFQTPENYYFLSPQWVGENAAVAVVLTDNGKRLAKFDLKSGNFRILFDQDLGEIKQLQIKNDKLYFIGGYSGKDALYSFDFATNEVMQLYIPRFGAAYPAISSAGEILLSDYTANGYRLIKAVDLQPLKIQQTKQELYPLATSLAGQEMGIPNLLASDTLKYSSERYSKVSHLFNFHSWAPVFVDPYNYEFASGISLMSQNKLGTAETVLGYRWNSSESNGDLYAHYIYKGWFPVIDLEASSGKRSTKYGQITEYTQNGQVVSRDTTMQSFDWTESNLNATVQFPVNLTRGIFYRLLQPEIAYNYTNYKTKSTAPDGFPKGSFNSLTYRLYYHQIRKSSYRDVLPDFGLILDGSYVHSPFGDNNLGSLLSGEGIMYLPGFKANHGIKLYGGAQDRINGTQFSYSDDIRFPRGWKRTGTRQMVVGTIDYKLPLLNPDWSIGGLTYIKRVSASVFFDYAHMTRNYYSNGEVAGYFKQNISSYGVELLSELNFLRFYAPVQLGGRFSYLPEIRSANVALLLSVDFNSL
ncbi:MAG: hypothetical protein ACK5M7_05270 [Draconibacterium sp.]